MAEAPGFMHTLVGRFDDSVFDPGRRSRCRIRLEVGGEGAWDAVTSGGRVSIQAAVNHPDAVLSADAETWQRLAVDLRGGMYAYRSGRLLVRRNLHLGVGFLAA